MSEPRQNAVLLIGAGRMGGALIKGWRAGGRFSTIHVVEPSPSYAVQALAGEKAIVLSPALDTACLPPVAAVVLAIKPQVLKNASYLLDAVARADALIVSIAAGITTGSLAACLGTDSRLVRAMPNTPGAIGRGITVLCGRSDLSPSDRQLAEALMASLGETLWVGDEALMDAVTALSGSGPAYLFLMAEAMAAAGRAQGLDAETADRLARATVSGAGALLAADRRSALELRKEVTSPGGTTEAALSVLTANDGLAALMTRAVAAATKRGKELGKS